MTNPFETNKTNNKIANSEKQNENKIKGYTQATKEKLDEINKQISDEISQNISINMTNVKANLQTQNIFGLIDGKVAVYIPLKILTNQNITINNIQIQFIDNNNNIVYEKTITDNIVMQPNQENTILSVIVFS